MPLATHWVCCRCGFGPMIIDSCSACLNCQHPGAKLSCCLQTALALHKTAAAATPADSYNELSLNDPISRHTLPSDIMPGFNAPMRQRGTSLYLCCVCGDGPKVYEHHCRCIVCQHDACSSCTYVK
ncbi:hypothetical protein FQN49_003508 [Arthroderma sp. PD_2]|nr:hypothetical protein FQN49_003508 [Arthroderma sp. PD_2]